MAENESSRWKLLGNFFEKLYKILCKQRRIKPSELNKREHDYYVASYEYAHDLLLNYDSESLLLLKDTSRRYQKNGLDLPVFIDLRETKYNNIPGNEIYIIWEWCIPEDPQGVITQDALPYLDYYLFKQGTTFSNLGTMLDYIANKYGADNLEVYYFRDPPTVPSLYFAGISNHNSNQISKKPHNFLRGIIEIGSNISLRDYEDPRDVLKRKLAELDITL